MIYRSPTRMINDPKSAHFISWTELGTRLVYLYLSHFRLRSLPSFYSFVVSNVGEFSRTILGSHFKHNNVRFCQFIIFNKGIKSYCHTHKFSSFVRQLNMYGFHKINRVSRFTFVHMTPILDKQRRHNLSDTTRSAHFHRCPNLGILTSQVLKSPTRSSRRDQA
jgi:HSF-type DNA-binding